LTRLVTARRRRAGAPGRGGRRALPGALAPVHPVYGVGFPEPCRDLAGTTARRGRRFSRTS